MAGIREPLAVRPFVGVLAAHERALAAARAALTDAFGPPTTTAGPFDFDHTDYYAAEIGPRPIRAFFAFDAPTDPAALATTKRRTNELEKIFLDRPDLAADDGIILSRPVNLDPGYVTLAKVVLASVKDFAHRVYLRDGIYAEVTLRYRRGARGGGRRDGRWTAFPWTFPDFAADRYHPFFDALRAGLTDQSKRTPD